MSKERHNREGKGMRVGCQMKGLATKTCIRDNLEPGLKRKRLGSYSKSTKPSASALRREKRRERHDDISVHGGLPGKTRRRE